jgi:hypothetical protein
MEHTKTMVLWGRLISRPFPKVWAEFRGTIKNYEQWNCFPPWPQRRKR